jgi:transposase
MDAKEAISRCLGLQHVEISDIELFPKAGRAEVEVRFRPENCRCPECGWKLLRIHDWQQLRLQGPPLGIFTRVVLRVFYPRAYCPKCRRNRAPKIPWRHPKLSSMSTGFAEIAGRMMEETTCEAAARLLRANSRSLWELDQFRMELLLSRMKLPPNVDVSMLSADEVHFRTLWVGQGRGPFAKQWEPQFVTNLVSYPERKVLSNATGRGGTALDEALSVLTNEQRLSVQKFSVDMHDAFIASARKQCPNAEIAVDRFHVAQHVNRAFDEVRRAEFKKARDSKNTFLQGMLAPSRRFILVERHRQRSRQETKLLAQLRNLNDAIHSAMLLTEQFHAALDKTDLSAFRRALIDWYLLVRESRLEPFRKLARTIAKYRHYIETYITSRLTTAVSEGINNKIKTLKRMAYGYTNPKSFKNKILQRCGYLNHYNINTNDLFWNCAANAP